MLCVLQSTPNFSSSTSIPSTQMLIEQMLVPNQIAAPAKGIVSTIVNSNFQLALTPIALRTKRS